MLVDTNILVYAINLSASKHELARNFLRNEFQNVVIAHQNILESLRVLTGQYWLRQESTQRRRPRARRPQGCALGVPCDARFLRRLRNSPSRCKREGSDSPRRHPRRKLSFSASLTGTAKSKAHRGFAKAPTLCKPSV